MIYDVDYFIRKFEAIPDDMVISESQGVRETSGNSGHCGIGWCRNLDGEFGSACRNSSLEARALIDLFISIGITYDGYNGDPETEVGWNVANVNNGYHPNYQQPTPKQRILAALYDIKKAQQPEVKEKTVYVTVDSSVRELQQKELSVN